MDQYKGPYQTTSVIESKSQVIQSDLLIPGSEVT